MLAPLRDYLSPEDPKSCPLLCTAKERYFIRMSTKISRDEPDFGETRWITTEDVNVEHLLDVFTTIDANSDDIWNACLNFMMHLYWHKARLTVLWPKIEGLPDGHHFKPRCLFELSRLIRSIGNDEESKRLLVHALKLVGGWGDDDVNAQILLDLSDVNRVLGLPKEGIQQAKEALEIFERLGDTGKQADCLIRLAQSLWKDKQLDAAEDAAFRAIGILPEKGEQFRVCESHHALGEIYESKGEIEKAIHHLEVALRIASPFNWHDKLYSIHFSLATKFLREDRFDDAQAHLERAKPHVGNHAYGLGAAMMLQAMVWYKQHRLEEARSEALRAIEIYEKLGAANDIEMGRALLQLIQGRMDSLAVSGQLREFLQMIPPPARINFPL